MTIFRHNKPTRLTRAVAVLVGLLLAQMLAAALLHTMLVDHIWCETHHEFEHVGRSVDLTALRARESRDPSEATRARPIEQHHPGDEKRSPGDLCHYLTSMHAPAIPLPSIQDALLSLPPPAEPAEHTRAVGAQAFLARQIDLLHESPGLSPPQLMASSRLQFLI